MGEPQEAVWDGLWAVGDLGVLRGAFVQVFGGYDCKKLQLCLGCHYNLEPCTPQTMWAMDTGDGRAQGSKGG